MLSAVARTRSGESAGCRRPGCVGDDQSAKADCRKVEDASAVRRVRTRWASSARGSEAWCLTLIRRQGSDGLDGCYCWVSWGRGASALFGNCRVYSLEARRARPCLGRGMMLSARGLSPTGGPTWPASMKRAGVATFRRVRKVRGEVRQQGKAGMTKGVRQLAGWHAPDVSNCNLMGYVSSDPLLPTLRALGWQSRETSTCS
jgi:hypothetical protein